MSQKAGKVVSEILATRLTGRHAKFRKEILSKVQ